MALRIRYQQLLRLTERKLSGTHVPQHGFVVRLGGVRSPVRSILFATQCPRQRQTFSTTQLLAQQDSPKPVAAAAGSEPSTSTSSSSQIPETTTPTPDSKKAGRLRRWIYAAFFLTLGTFAGGSFRLIVSPPPPPEPHTADDGYTIELLHEQAARLPVVQQLAADPAWESWPAYESLSPEHRGQHLMAGVMAGSRGVGGYHRVFHNASTGELVSVVFFGGATVGWPGVVHGGLLATVLDESCGRAAFKQWGDLVGVTAKLELRYLKSTLANGFYVIRARARPDEELPESERGKSHYKSWVDATVEDAATGVPTVVAQAIFVGGQGKNKGKKGGWMGGEAKVEHVRF